jgi:hypothetical protein
MGKAFAVVGGVILFVALILGLDFAGNAYGLWSYTFWAPKQAAAENKVYENNTIYVQGKRETLNRLRRDYKTADPAHKAAIKEEILSEAVNVDLNKLPGDLHAFVDSLQEDGQ